MRARPKIIQSLENVYREAFAKAEEDRDRPRMEALDFGFQRDQVLLEVLLDIREALSNVGSDDRDSEPSLLEKARTIRKFTKLKLP